jgi:hypothetical protein
MQRSVSRVCIAYNVRISTTLEQTLGQTQGSFLLVWASDHSIQRSVAIGACGIDVGSMSKQRAYYCNSVCIVYRRLSEAIGGIDTESIERQHVLQRLGVFRDGSQTVQHGLTVLIVCIDIGAMGKQLLHDGTVSGDGRLVQWRVSAGIDGVHVGSLLDQHVDHLAVSDASSEMQRRALAIAFDIDRELVFEEHLNGIEIGLLDSNVQRCVGSWEVGAHIGVALQ